MQKYRTKDGDTLDAICWAHYGQQAGAVEDVLEANPGLAQVGTIFSAGVLIELPSRNAPSQTIQPVRLWD